MTSRERDTYRIAVAHDLEKTGDEAMEEACALARRLASAELHVVHVLSRPSAQNAGKNDRRLEDALVELKARVETMLARDPGLTAHVHVRFGNVAEAVIQVAVDYDADLILVGTHGRRGLDRVRNRSIAERLVRTAPLPVLVAHAKDFARLALSERPERARPGEAMHAERKLSELVITPAHVSHIAGLV
jgi:nucleotide-binding universal stress UspA family protein